MRVDYTVTGDRKVIHDLLGIGRRAVETRPLLLSIGRVLARLHGERFDSQGDGTWEPLAETTKARKAALNQDPRILHATLELREDLAGSGAGHVEDVIGDELVFGTTNFKARLHQEGTSRMPARPPFVDLAGEGVLRQITKGIQAYLIGAERAEFGVAPYGLAALDPFGIG